MAYKMYDGEDETTYVVVALTKKETKLKEPPETAFSLDANSYKEGKGIIKGILNSNNGKYVYAFLIKVISGYFKEDWQIKSSEIVYDAWLEEELDESTLS